MPEVRTLLGILQGDRIDPAVRAEVLGQVVLDLLMEVEALRRAVQDLSDRAGPRDVGDDALDGRDGSHGPRTAYAAAYAGTAWLTHCAAGPSGGWEKLLETYYGGTSGRNRPPDGWRECLMLKRLGLSDAEVAEYMASASQAETYT